MAPSAEAQVRAPMQIVRQEAIANVVLSMLAPDTRRKLHAEDE